MHPPGCSNGPLNRPGNLFGDQDKSKRFRQEVKMWLEGLRCLRGGLAHLHRQGCCHQGRVGWVFFPNFRCNPACDCHQLEPKCPGGTPPGHFVNFSEHKTCIRKLPASVNMCPEVTKIPRAQKAAGMLFPNALWLMLGSSLRTPFGSSVSAQTRGKSR